MGENIKTKILDRLAIIRKNAEFFLMINSRVIFNFLFSESPSTLLLFKRYWHAYGGFEALLESFYFRASFLLSILLSPLWVDYEWPSLVLTLLPNILGFSIAAYTAILAFSDRDFVDFVITSDNNTHAQNSEDKRPNIHQTESSSYMKLNATFLHFIIMQVTAIILALICSVLAKIQVYIIFIAFSSFSFLIFIYAILLAAAATMGVFRIAFIYQIHRLSETKKKKETHESTFSQDN